MSNSVVRAAIEGRLKAWAAEQVPPIKIAFQNVAFTPTSGTSYLRGTIIPAQTKNQSVGGLHKHYHGMYQVSVYVPEGSGPGDAETLTKAIEVLFKCPTTIVQSGRNVNVLRTPAVAQGMPDGSGFFMTPVTIWYDMDDFT